MKTVNTNKSTVTWTGKKLGGSHNGTIKLKSGDLQFNDSKVTGGNFTIDMTTIDVTDLTGENKTKLEGHLKSDDFFATSTHEEATLVFTNVKEKSPQVYEVTGDLTIKGITNPITFDLQANDSSATTQLNIDRSKYDVKYGSKSFFKGLGDNFIYDNFEVDVKLVY
ncbi:YceI family protein [Nonlabens ponticola]|uniref:YceI family protein n=2 Tax=Nonlabens ponticola TaxID=2496866 RepID=A0A3S9N1N8_9FLAO|nr:YceI family protein [Nonlabens ponticola]